MLGRLQVVETMTTRVSMRMVLTLLAFILCTYAKGQLTEILDKNIKTVRLVVNDTDDGRLPVMRLGTTDELRVSFDELSHDYHRYTYKIEHLDATFQSEPSLFETDYVRATADEGLIEDYENSTNTSVLYTHYTFTLPNDYLRPLLSGNYRLTVTCSDDEDNPRTAFHAFFYVTEDAASLTTSGTTNTEIDWNTSHQQLAVHASLGDIVVRDPDKEIFLVVLQNNRWDNAAIAPRPTGRTVSSVIWEHSKQLIFDAGNEYRKFELPSTRYPGLHVDKIGFYDPCYHATLMPDAPRPNYLYDEDQNGRSVILSDGYDDADITADYVWVHFSVSRPETLPEGSRVFVNGNWSYGQFIPEYELRETPGNEAFEGAVLLKQGYYSYRYHTIQPKGAAIADPIEGNYFQTENEYTFLLYYRQTGARYDRLIGWRTASYKPV